MLGIFARIAKRGYTSLYYKEPALQAAFYEATLHLKEQAVALELDVRFPAVAESTRTLPDALYTLSACGLIHYYDHDIILHARRLALVDLSALPGTPQLYTDLADTFLKAYNAAH